MAEDGNVSSNAAPAPNTAGAPVANQIDPAEYARLQAENQRLGQIETRFKGAQSFYTKASEAGFKRPEDFAEIGAVMRAISERGMTMAQVAALLGSGGREPEQHGTQQPVDLDKKFTEFKSQFAREQAEQAHYRQLEAEEAELAQDRIDAILEDAELPPPVKALFRSAAVGQYMQSRTPYPEGHPMHGYYAPAGSDGIGKVKSFVGDGVKALRDHYKASQMKQIGESARRSSTTTPSGPNTANGRGNEGKEGDPLAEANRKAEEFLAKKYGTQR